MGEMKTGDEVEDAPPPEIVVHGRSSSSDQRRAIRKHQRHVRSRRAQQQQQQQAFSLETVPEVHGDIDFVDIADETEERDYFPPPSTGPHTLIEHEGFRFFWGVFFGRVEHVKTSAFCSALLRYLAMPAPAGGEQHLGVLPLPPMGMGLPEREIIQLDRGSPRSIMDGLVLALDLDESGRISAAMLGRALLSLPADTSLRDSVYLLAEQRGRVLLPAPVVVSAAYVCGLVRSLQALGPGQDKCQDLYSPFALHGEEVEVFGGRGTAGPRGAEGEGGVQDRLEANMRVPGWSLLCGAAGMGRTARAVAACRAILHSIRLQDPHAAPSVAAAVSVSQALLDPLSSASSTAHSIAQLGALHRLDALYLDFRAASSRAEVLGATMAQLGLSGCAPSLRAAELRLGRLLASLKPGSVLLLDNVSADCCAVLTSLMDPFSAVLSLLVVSGPQGGGEGEGERRGGDAALVELMDEVSAAPCLSALTAIHPVFPL